MGELQLSVSELSLQMRQQDRPAHSLHWLHLLHLQHLTTPTAPTLLTTPTLLYSPVQDWAVWSQRLQRLEQAALRQSEAAGTTSHDVGLLVPALPRLALQPTYTPTPPHTPHTSHTPCIRSQVAELQQLARQQEGTAETAAQLRELTTILYKSWATVQQLAADKAHAAASTAEASPGGRRRLAEASPAARRPLPKRYDA